MSNENKLTPELRFPEFKGKPFWEEEKLYKVLFEHGQKSEGNEEVFSVSVHKGVINQIEHLGRRFAAASTDNYKRVLPGDVIYTKSPTGDFPYGIIKQSKVSKPVIVSPLYAVFTPETIWLGIILDAYFEYPERTINYLASIVQKGAKNTINIRNDVFLSKSLVLPNDKKEQNKIASCLSNLDDLIASHSDKLKGLKDHKKGLMQNLFPQEGESVPTYRFTEFEKDGEWVEKALGEVAEIITGNTPSTKEPSYYGVGKMFVSPADIGDNRIVNQTKTTLTELGFSKTRQIKARSVLFVCIGSTIGKVAQNMYECATNQQINSLLPLKGYSRNFLYSILDCNSTKIASIAGNHVVPIINKTSFSSIKISFPPKLEEQQKIASCLSSLDGLITAQAAKIEQLKLHKKGLMQGLFPNVNERL